MEEEKKSKKRRKFFATRTHANPLSDGKLS